MYSKMLYLPLLNYNLTSPFPAELQFDLTFSELQFDLTFSRHITDKFPGINVVFIIAL